MPHTNNAQRNGEHAAHRKHKTRVHFFPITNDPIQGVPAFVAPPEFDRVRTDERVANFIANFCKWNHDALRVMSHYSHPNFDMQEHLARMIGPHLGEVVLDIGAGAGNFHQRLFDQVPGAIDKMKRIFAVDFDWETLSNLPKNMRDFGYRGKVGLVVSATWSPLPIWDQSVDCIISSIGGLTYAGWRFDESGHFVCEGRSAMKMALADMNRVMKDGGHLGFSSLRPDPNFEMVLKDSLLWPLLNFKFRHLMEILLHGFHIKNISQFLHEAERNGNAQYLSVEEWTLHLQDAGFEVVDSSIGNCYAGQGVVIVAKKVRDLSA